MYKIYLIRKTSKNCKECFTKGFLIAWLSLVTLLPIILQHDLEQTKKHLLWQYITTSKKQQKA